jgi:N-acetyl-anhydromuramyl-L-alanine amidase AmpD
MKFTRIIKLGMKGTDVTFLQNKLKEFGFFRERVDGNFGQNLLVAVAAFQKRAGLKQDGICGPQTWNRLINWSENSTITKPKEEIKLQVSYSGEGDLKIYDSLLSDDEYIKQEVKKETIYLHHTAGGSRPDWSIGGWEKDQNRDGSSIKIATSYVIGRKSSSTGDDTWDGVILRAFDDRYWAYHLGISKKNVELNSKSIGIELCNYGPLTLRKDGKFYNWVNKPVMESEVCELDQPFRGFKYYEKYTDRQIDSLRKLILHLQKKWSIGINSGIYNPDWFNYDEKWFSNGGLRSHTQVRLDKYDVFPQKELIQMLQSL